MAEIIVGFLSPLIEVGKLLKDQFSYLCCLNDNVRILGTEAANLNTQIKSLEEQVNYDENTQRRQILPNITEWLNDAKEMEENADIIKREKGEIEQKGCVFAMKSRYVLSKKAIKLVYDMKSHHEKKRHLYPISTSPRPPCQLPPPPVPFEIFDSRKGIAEDIMKALREKAPKLIGIHGMGGVGKTTMAEKLKERVYEEKLFQDVLKVVVGSDVDVLKIQRNIAQQLGLNDSLGEGIERKLHDRLSGDNGAFILIDDIWSPLELAELGLPLENCTILLTSRIKGALTQMNVNIFDMDVLKDDEALDLLLKEARINYDDRKLLPKAKEIVEECGGLPLALKIIGRFLRGKEDDRIWDDTVRQLKSSDLGNIPNFDQKVCRVLKFSIDKLDDRDSKALLFLCSQFPEDATISLDDLALYCISLRLFTRKYNFVNQAKDRVHTVVEILKNCSLLLDGGNKNSVKMHDLIRDTVAKVIEERSYCKWISNKVPETSDEICQKLGLLGIASGDQQSIDRLLSSSDQTKEVSSLVFENLSFTLLPASMNLLKNLRMLYLEKCQFECISIVGELLGLEVLKCLYCYYIKELPLEIKELKNLKFMEFRDCYGLERVVPEVISNLVELEELAIWNSFRKWASRNVKDSEAQNASLKEIESLKKLRVLRIDILDIDLVEEDIQLPSSLENYGIRIGYHDPLWNEKYDKWISLSPSTYDEAEYVGKYKYANWICQLLLKAEAIAYYRMGAYELVPNQNDSFNNLTKLRIHKCSKIT